MKLRSLSCHLFTLLALTTGMMGAQPKSGVDRAEPPTPQASTPAKSNTVNVDFPGGTLGNFLTLLAKNEAVSFNLIGEKDLMSTPLPPLSLRNVTLMAVYEVLKRLLGPRGLSLDMAEPGYETVVCVLTRREPTPPPRVVQPVQFVSFQLWRYLEYQTIDAIVDAIRAAWELDPSRDKTALKLKFHPATSILLVSGPGDALHLTKSVLDQLKGSDEKSPPPPANKR